MIRKTSHIIVLIISLCCLAEWSIAQKKVQVATKTIKEALDVKERVTIRVEGEKANIEIVGWNKKRVEAEIKLIAKHPDKAVVAKEIKYMKHIFQGDRKNVYFKNYYSFPIKTDQPNANLQAIFILKVPAGANIEIINHFGNIKLEDLYGTIDLQSEYGKVNLQNIAGVIDFYNHFSDINGSNISTSTAQIITQHSNINLLEVEGDYTIKSEYGDVELQVADESLNVELEGDKTNIKLLTTDYKKHNYSLLSKFGKIKIPKGLQVKILKDNNSKKHIEYKKNKQYGLLDIKTSFGDIILE